MPQENILSAQIFMRIGRRDAPRALLDDLAEVEVDTSLYLPDMFTILLRDPQLEWVDHSLFDIGQEIEIAVQTAGEQGQQAGTLIKGEITAVEPTFSAQGQTTLLIRGYDKSHRLHRGRQIRTFTRQSDGQIVQKIAGEVGLNAQVDSTGITYDYVLQNNQTNMEFLLARAGRIGYQVYVSDETLYFEKGDASRGNGPELELGETLQSFRPCWTATHQADQVIVKGWDAKGKQTITSQVAPGNALNQGGMSETGGETAKQAFGAAEMVLSDRPIFTVDEAAALAQGLSHDIGREFVQAEGLCTGDPRIKAGWKITIRGVGQRFSGPYFVTSATHLYHGGGYETRFEISGRQPNTLSHLLASGNGHDQTPGQVQGVVTGLVTNLNDPDNLGRVKVKYAWLGNIESDWMRIATPMAGAERGFYYLPEINDEALIAFQHGDVHHPYIVGVLWNNQDKPPKPNSAVVGGGKVNERILRSRSGHVIVLDDSDGSEKIIIRDKTEKNEIQIDSSRNSMTIKVEGDFTVEARGKIMLKSTQDMSLETQANAAIKANGNLNAEALGNGTVKGTQLNLEGTAKAALKAPAVSLEGSALAEVKAALVKLN